MAGTDVSFGRSSGSSTTSNAPSIATMRFTWPSESQLFRSSWRVDSVTAFGFTPKVVATTSRTRSCKLTDIFRQLQPFQRDVDGQISQGCGGGQIQVPREAAILPAQEPVVRQKTFRQLVL